MREQRRGVTTRRRPARQPRHQRGRAGAVDPPPQGSDVRWAPAILRPAVEALGEAPVLVDRPRLFEPGQKLAFNRHGRESRLIIECLVENSDACRASHGVRETLGAEGGASAGYGVQVEYISPEGFALAAFGREWDET
ncbi:MAG: hypothetical protein U5R48_07150 [Gammaproteobacteria bacterium]|nr:hypothetical protein [Gammaproteobacteria bacterium]